LDRFIVGTRRSGSSIDYLASLVEHLPEVYPLHIHRDGPGAAGRHLLGRAG
jgi:hypothetical protein